MFNHPNNHPPPLERPLQPISPLETESLSDFSFLTHPLIISSLSSTSQHLKPLITKVSSLTQQSLPIKTQLTSKHKSDYIYQHPTIHSFPTTTFLQIPISLFEPSSSSLNTYNLNSSFKNLSLSLYSNSIYSTYVTSLSDITSYLPELKHFLTSNIRSITTSSSSSNSFNSHLMIINIGLNQFTSLSFTNVNDIVQYSKTFRNNFSMFFNNEANNIMYIYILLNKDTQKIFAQINEMIHTTNDNNIRKQLVNIVFNLSSCLKSLYGYLCVIEYIQELNTNIDEEDLKWNFNDCLMTTGECGCCGFVNVTEGQFGNCGFNVGLNDNKDSEISKFVFSDLRGCFGRKDLMFLYMESIGLMRVAKTCVKDNEYNVIQSKKIDSEYLYGSYSNSNSNNNVYTNAFNYLLFTYEECYLFLFNINSFQTQEDNNDKLFTIIDFNLNNISNYINITCDDTVNEILYTKSMNIYLNVLTNILSDISAIPTTSSIGSNKISIAFENNKLYIIHPICNVPKQNMQSAGNVNEYIDFMSNEYIYVCDIIQLSSNEMYMNDITLSYVDSRILCRCFMNENAQHERKRKIMDELFQEKTTSNLFVVGNGVLYSKHGDYILNTNMSICRKDNCNNKAFVIPDSQVNKNIVLCYENHIYSLSDWAFDNNKHISIYEKKYTFNSYAKSNSFNNNILLREISSQLTAYNKQSSIPLTSEKNDIFNDLFNTPTTATLIDNNDNKVNLSSLNQIDLILYNLCIYLDRTQCHNNSNSMKDKHVLSLDYPTLMCFNRLIIVNKTNAKRLFCLLMLLKHHFVNMKRNKICASVVFGKESAVYETIDILMKVSKDVQDMKELIYEIVFDLLCTCEFIKGKQLDDILSNMDFICNSDINSKCYLCLFDYCCYSKTNMNHFMHSDYSFKINTTFISHLTTVEINSLQPNASSTHKLHKSFHLFHKHYLTFYSHFYSNIIHNSPLHNNNITSKHLLHIYNDLSSLILPHFSNQSLLHSLLTSSTFIIPLLHFTISITLSTYNSFPNSFTLQFWHFFFSIVQSLSSLKQHVLSNNHQQIPLQHQHDIIIDNTAFTDEQSKSIIYAPSFNKSEMNLYIEAIVINKLNDNNNSTNSNSCSNIVSIENNKTNVKILNINACYGGNIMILYEYHKILNGNIENEMKITFHEDAKNFLVKVRISNYEFSLRYIDIILEPCIELFNQMLHTFTNYTINEEMNGYYNTIMNLFNTRLFSQGFPLNKSSTYLNEDIELFCKSISHCDTFKHEFTANMNVYVYSDSTSDNVSLDMLLTNDKLNKVLCSFDNKQRILIKGDVPDLLVKIAFYIILKHENILAQFTSFHNADDNNNNHSMTSTMIVSSSMKQNVYDNYFAIWKECSTLRTIYKSKKDAYMNSNTNMTTAFDNIVSKLKFIYNLLPQTMQSHSNICYNNKNSFTNAFSNIIKEHVNTITSLITNDAITKQTIVKGYEYVQIKAKFREISIQILTKAISVINDNSVTSNMLCNYYNSFTCKNGNSNSSIVSLPSIYDSLFCVNGKIVMNITEAFHKLLDVVVNKIKCDANINRFNMSVYANFLMWNIRKRNYKFIIESKVFDLFHTNNNTDEDISFIDKGNKYLFVYPQTENDSNNNKFNHFSEITPIDDCHIGKLLTDVFECYAIRIIHLDLVNINTYSNYNSDIECLLKMILDVFVNQLCVIISLCDKQSNNNNNTSNSNNISNYTFPYEHNVNHSDFFIKSAQLKLYNILNILNKICILYYRKNNYIFKHHELWVKIFTLLTHANYTNTRLIFSVLKLFTQIEEDNIIHFYNNKITLNNKHNESVVTIKDYFNYILTTCKYKDLVCDYFINYSLTVCYNDICEFITNKIINEEQLHLLLFFNVNMNLLTHFSPLITNTKLLLESKTADYEVTQRELDLFITKGYFISAQSSPNSNTNSNSNHTGNINHNNHNRRNSRRSSRNSSSSSSSRSGSDNSHSSVSNASSHCDNDIEYNDLEELLNNEIDVKRELPVLLADIKDNHNVDFISVNQNEIVYDDAYLHKSISPLSSYDNNICEYIMNYIQENLFTKGKISPFYIENYIRALKYLIRCSNTHTTCVNMKTFFIANKHHIDSILQYKLPSFDCSLLFTDKIENVTALAINALTDKNENANEGYFDNDKRNEKEMKVKRKCYCTINISGNTISLYGGDHKRKYTMSIVDRVELSSNKNEELFEGEVVVLNKKEYDVIVMKCEEKRKELLKGVVFVLCEDLLVELGVNEKDYVESQERKVMKYGENENDDTVSEDAEEDETPEYYSEDESIPPVKKKKKDKRNKHAKKSKEDANDKEKENDVKDVNDAIEVDIKDVFTEDIDNEKSLNHSLQNDNDNDKDNESQHNNSVNGDANNCDNSINKSSHSSNNNNPPIENILNTPPILLSQSNHSNKKAQNSPQLSSCLPKLFQSSSWKAFLTSLLSYCDLTKCHFLIESKYFHKIPKNFSIFSYNSSSFPTTSLSQDTLYSSITSKQTFPFETFDINTALPTLSQAQPQSPNNTTYHKLLSAFKVKTEPEKQKIKNRFLNPKLTFNKLNTCTPLLTDDNTLTHEQIIHYGVYLLKYYLLLLLITNKEEIPFNYIKLLYYISRYQAKYFNIKRLFTLVQQSVYTYIHSNDITDMISKCEVFDYQKTIYEDTMIDTLIQDEFIKDVYDCIINVNDNKMSQCEIQLCTYLLNKANMCLYNNDLEQSVIIMNIVNHISHNSHQQLRILTVIMESEFMRNISKQISLSIASLSKMQRQTDFNITCIEFLINQWVIIDSKQLPNFRIDDCILKLYKDYTILLNKFSCKHLIEHITLNTTEYKANTKCIIHLPLKQDNNNNSNNALPYAIKIHKAYTDKYFIPSQQLFTNDNNNILLIFELSSSTSSSSSTDINKNVHYNINTNITTKTNSIAIINDSIAQFNSYIISHFDNLKRSDIKQELSTIRTYPYIKTVHCINDNFYIGIGYDNKLYTYGSINGSNNHHSRSKCFVYSQELNNIHTEDTIYVYGKKSFLSESGIYFCKNDFPEELDTIRVSDNIRKFNINGVLPNGERFIMVKYFPMLIALTQSGKLYGSRCSGDKCVLFENESEVIPRNTLKLIQTKSTHVVIDYVMDYDMLIYVVYDTELQKNIVLANGKGKYWYIFNDGCEELFYAKEILYLTDKNITQVAFQRDEELFFVSKEGKAFSIKSASSNLKEVKYFNRKQYDDLTIKNIGQMVCFTAVNECNGKKEVMLCGSCDNLDTFVKKGKNGTHKNVNVIDYDMYMNSKCNKKEVKDNSSNSSKACVYKSMNCLLSWDHKLYPCFDIYVPGVNVLCMFDNDNHNSKNDNEYKFICEVVDNSNSNGLRYVIELVKMEKEVNNMECFVFNISSSSLLSDNDSKGDDDYVFIDKSNKQCELNVLLIEQLSLFVISIEHLCQIALCLHEKKVNALLNKPLHTNNVMYTFNKTKILSIGKHRSLKLFIFPNTTAPSIYDNTYQSIYTQIQSTLSSLTVTDLTEYLSSKQFFLSNNKSTLPFASLTEFLLNKYRTYDKYSHLSNEHILNILDKASHEFISSARNLLKHSSLTLNNSIINTLVFDNIALIDKPTRDELFLKHFKSLHKSTSTEKISVSRVTAMKHKTHHQLTDSNFTWTVFAQLMDKLSFTKCNYYLKPKGQELFTVTLEGEGAYDAGGPFREIVTLAFEELTSMYIDMFIPTPNNKSQSGNDRDKYTINPKANTIKHLNAFEFLGKFIAYIISSECYVSLPLSSFVYKQMLNLPIEVNDIANIDIHSYNSIIKVLSDNSDNTLLQKESLYNVLDFTCQLSNGDVVELKENGRNVMLNASNEKEYLDLYIQTRISECAEQIRFIKKGLYAVIPPQLFKFLTWEDLEEKICGEPFFNVELLRKNTRYQGFKESDATIKYFWRFINECTVEEKYQYIKFVWGRSRLPKDNEWNDDKHEINKLEGIKEGDVNMMLPISHTCFFMLDLPAYTSYHVLKEKLLYSMRNSFIISDSELRLDLDIK